MRTTAIVVTGPPGAGKSSVVERLCSLLEADGIEFGAVESEELGWGHPWIRGEPVLRQLRVLLALQRELGRRLFVIVATTETKTELAQLTAATEADTVVTVLLLASPKLVAARLAQREPDEWRGKARLIEHARKLATSMRRLTPVDLTFRTDGREAGDVARELRDELRAFGIGD